MRSITEITLPEIKGNNLKKQSLRKQKKTNLNWLTSWRDFRVQLDCKKPLKLEAIHSDTCKTTENDSYIKLLKLQCQSM